MKLLPLVAATIVLGFAAASPAAASPPPDAPQTAEQPAP